MNSSRNILGIALLLCVIGTIGAVGGWVFGYARGQGAGVATFGMGLITFVVLLAFSEACRPEEAPVLKEVEKHQD